MIVGFTGTRERLTHHQDLKLIDVLRATAGSAFSPMDELHHGDCLGADARAHSITLSLGLSIVIHPPVDERERAFCEGARLVLPAKTHFARNRDIVGSSALVIGCILHWDRSKGGTWYTLNYAKKRGIPVCIIDREGLVHRE